jgi:dynein heavy chain
VTVQDQENGRYLVSFVPKTPGTYIISAEFLGSFGGQAGHIRASPTYAKFDDFVSRDNNSMMGKVFVDSLKTTLTFLGEFTKTTYAGLMGKLQDDSWTHKDVTDAIVRMREHIMNVEGRGDEILLSLDRCREVCENLKSQGVNVTSLEGVLDTARQTWDAVLRELPNTIIRVNPLVKANSIRMKQEIQRYEEKVRAYLNNLQEGAWKSFETGQVAAIQLLDEAQGLHAEEDKKCDEMVHLSNIFECPRDMQKPLDLMHVARDHLSDYRELWDLATAVHEFVNLCKESYWTAINPDAMEEVAKEHVSSLKRLPRSVKESGAYAGLEKSIRDFIRTCPLIAALRHVAMRDRHWTELGVVTGKSLTPPSQTPSLRLNQVLELELHNFAADVEEITDKALKELKQEQALAGLEKTWASVVFNMSLYKDSDVPLLRLGEEDMEVLEADMLALQGMASSRYVFFKAQSLTWHKALSAVAEVVGVLGDIQRLWSYLEPLFVGSEEVKRELPTDAQRFQGVDSQVRELLKTMWKTRNVKQACNAPRLLSTLELLHRELETCRKSLVDFLDGKRRLFPRFYFTSEADLLDMLSNGSSPARILRHIEKVLLATKTLELRQPENEGARPSAIKV